MSLWSAETYPPNDKRMTAKEAHRQLILCLDRLAKHLDAVRIVMHSRLLADGLQKLLRNHSYHEVEFGGFGALRFEKVCRYPTMNRIIVCVASNAQSCNSQQWYVNGGASSTLLGVELRI